MRFEYHFFGYDKKSKLYPGFYCFFSTKSGEYGFQFNLNAMLWFKDWFHDGTWYDGEWSRYGIGPFQIVIHK